MEPKEKMLWMWILALAAKPANIAIVNNGFLHDCDILTWKFYSPIKEDGKSKKKVMSLG